MKKLIALLLSIVMVFGLVACSAPNGNGDKKDSKTYENLAIAIDNLTDEEYGIAFRKGSDLTDEVNKIVNELRADGSLDAISDKYKVELSDSVIENTEAVNVKDIDYVKNKGVLIIGITDYAPMNYKDDAGNWTGFDTEFALKVCEKLGVKAEFLEIDWDNKFIALESKTIDCIWNGMTITPEVRANTRCTNAYAKNKQVVVMTKENAEKYKTIDSMKDLSFAVEAGSAAVGAADSKGFTNVIEVTAQTDALLEVQSGSCDACIIDLTMAQAMLGK